MTRTNRVLNRTGETPSNTISSGREGTFRVGSYQCSGKPTRCRRKFLKFAAAPCLIQGYVWRYNAFSSLRDRLCAYQQHYIVVRNTCKELRAGTCAVSVFLRRKQLIR